MDVTITQILTSNFIFSKSFFKLLASVIKQSFCNRLNYIKSYSGCGYPLCLNMTSLMGRRTDKRSILLLSVYKIELRYDQINSEFFELIQVEGEIKSY